MASNNNFTLNGSGVTPNPLVNQNNLTGGMSTLKTQTSTPVTSSVSSTASKPVSSGIINQPSNGSIVDYLNSQGKASDYNTRAGLAGQYGISGYSGTAEQNTALLNALRGGTKPSGTTSGLINNNLGASTASPSNSGTGVSNAVVPGNADGSTNLTGLTGQAPATPKPEPYTVNPGLQGQLITGLANTSQQPGAAYMAAQEQANQIAAQRERLAEDYAQKTNNIAGTAGFLTQQTGLQGLLQNQFNQGQAALSAQEQSAASRLSAANTQQQLQQSALTGAIGANAPITGVPYGTQVYNPSTGQFTSGGTAFQGGQVAGEQALGQQYAQNVSANNQALGIKNQIVSFLNATPINPSQFTDLNSVIGLLSGKVSDPKYTQLSAQLTEYLNTLAPILGVGGDTTNLKTQIAQSMLDGRMQPKAIVDVLNTIEQTAQTKLNQQKLGGGTQTNTSNPNIVNTSAGPINTNW